MLTHMKAEWRQFAARRPGRRFAQEYRERRAERTSPWSRIASIALGVLVTAAGLVALPMPGPGMLIVAFGLALLARESLPIAHLLDRAEPVLRRWVRGVKRWWKEKRER